MDKGNQSEDPRSRPTDGRILKTINETLDHTSLGTARDPDYRQRYEAEAVRELFSYHPPSPEQIPKYQAIRTAAKRFAEDILANVPAGRDRTAAIDMLRDSVMLANSAIALDGRSWSF